MLMRGPPAAILRGSVGWKKGQRPDDCDDKLECAPLCALAGHCVCAQVSTLVARKHFMNFDAATESLALDRKTTRIIVSSAESRAVVIRGQSDQNTLGDSAVREPFQSSGLMCVGILVTMLCVCTLRIEVFSCSSTGPDNAGALVRISGINSRNALQN